MIHSNKFGFTAVFYPCSWPAVAQRLRDESTDIEDTAVQTGQVDTRAIDDSASGAASAADTSFLL